MKLTRKYSYLHIFIFAFFAIAVLIFTYGGCNKGGEDGEQTEEVETPTPTPIPTPTPTPIPTPTPMPTPTPTPMPTPTLIPVPPMPPLPTPDPIINWNPTNITDIISPGESKSVEVTFVSTKDLKNVEVFVVPKLQPYVQVSPSSFSHVRAGIVTPLTIMFSASSNAELGTFDGTIHTKSTEKNGSTYVKPLHVILNIWNRFEIKMNDFTVAIAYPPGWELSRHGFGAFIYNPIYSQPSNELAPPDITIQVLENKLCLPLRDYIVEYKEGWYSFHQNSRHHYYKSHHY